MDKKKIFIIIPVLIAAALLAFLIFDGRSSNVDLSLEDLKSNGEYCFYGIEWDLPVEEVERALPRGIEKDVGVTPPEYTGYVYYVSKNTYTLDGVEDAASVQFYKGGLEIVQFSFLLGENYQQWFEKQVTELTQLYGSHSDMIENSSDQFDLESTVYSWEADNSRLQIALITGGKRRPSVILSVGKKITEERSYEPNS